MNTPHRLLPKPLVLLLAVTLGLPVLAADHPQLKPFPAAKEGQERYVIVLPHKERGEENSFKVELIVGKMMMTDGVNRVRLGGTIEAKPLKGWGYTYYQVDKIGPGMSTRMAPRPGVKPVEKFVTMSPLQIRYNSRLPIVVLVPKGCEVRYRIWSAPEKLEEAEQG
jgi:ecotin